SGLGLVPLWQHQLVAACLAEYAADSQRELVEQAAAGSVLLSFSLQGLAAGRGLGLRLGEQDGRLMLQGQANAVDVAAQADQLLLVVSTADGPRLVLLDTRSEGVELIAGVANHGLAVADVQCRNVLIDA